MKLPSFFRPSTQKQCRSSALLITLLMLSLITIIAVAFLGTMTWETSSARRTYDGQKAQALAMLGMNTAVGQLRIALDTWDNPYANFATNPPTFYWSSSPGIITRWSYTSATPLTNYPLFSTGSTNLVNLNAPAGDGSYPIAGGSSAPNISVYWANVLKNPANGTASAANPIVGRYAFWIDDESAKINVNTADGTMKYKTNSLGLGSPSEMSLQVLQQAGSSISTQTATNIVYLARTTGLNSAKEILRASGTTPDLYTNNVFYLTAYNRSPDLNIFGQPKMAMIPLLGAVMANGVTTDMMTNGITLRPATEIYPSPAQLPKFGVLGPVAVPPIPATNWFPTPANSVVRWEPWPSAFRAFAGRYNSGTGNSINSSDGGGNYTATNYAWINGMMVAKYLSGKNSAGTTINWPTYEAGSPATGFAGKYTLRQIDSIVAQIISLGGKEISPDYPPVLDDRGLRANSSPFLFNGWLSRQWVNGLSRAPKVTAIKLSCTTYPSVGTIAATPGPLQYINYLQPPQATLDIWLQWWLPAGYLGGTNVISIPANATARGNSFEGSMNLGNTSQKSWLNSADLTTNTTSANGGALLPRTSAAISTNWWGNQLLTNNQGIDFQANPGLVTNVGSAIVPLADPDQISAQAYHPYLLTNGYYRGAGGGLSGTTKAGYNTPFSMTAMQANVPTQDWLPGELRCQRSLNGTERMGMQTNAGFGANTVLNIGGGIQVRSLLVGGWVSDIDPVPLESIRGAYPWNSTTSTVFFDNEQWSSTSYPGTTLLRDRFVQEVIPIQLNVPIPGTSSVVMSVADPLVNKFPGDWTVTPGAALTYWSTAGSGNPSTYSSASEYASGFHDALTDPDSYWLPQADCAISAAGDIAAQTLIPRSARFPNIGYLQYIRTGIMPDTETPLTPGLEHGTPFRLLSYAPLTDSSNQKTTASGSTAYPDWAMLDLFYMPSLLSSYGSPYGYYQITATGTGAWQGYGNDSVLANFSTAGGSTPGRINPNGIVLYTTNSSVPQPGVARLVPIQALLQGIKVNQTLNTQTLAETATTPIPGYTGGTTVNSSISETDPTSIPVAIESYLRSHGPLKTPGEICNIPEIAALRPTANATRNDLVRQVVGNVTTQSNTFSVWVAGQSILKARGNTSYGVYEPGDQISATVRYHFIVERYLNQGVDGVYGNAVNPGVGGGIYNDLVDTANVVHPFLPQYLYRVVAAEEIR